MDTVYDFVMRWNDRLRAARDAAGVTDTDIARACGVKNPSVNGWMTGATKTIEGENLLKVCAFLQTSPEWIVFGKKEDEPKVKPAFTMNLDAELDRAVELMQLYKELSPNARDLILQTARLAKTAGENGSVDGDKAQAGL
jgi:transcriptional regulator with XRE-family HTH domain